MNINLSEYKYFTFSWLNTSLETIKKYMVKENNYKIIDKYMEKLFFEYNPRFFNAYFIKTFNGIIMISNLEDGWSSLFYNITLELKISGYHFKISSNDEKEPYNCLIYIENGIERRICSNIKENSKWIFYEKGEPLYFEETENYKNRLKRERLNKDIIITYLNKLNIIKENILEIDNKGKIIIEYKNY